MDVVFKHDLYQISKYFHCMNVSGKGLIGLEQYC